MFEDAGGADGVKAMNVLPSHGKTPQEVLEYTADAMNLG